MMGKKVRPSGATAMIDDIEGIVGASAAIPGWWQRKDARELALASYSLPDGAAIAEIGAFMGSGTVLLAGPRRLKGSGKVHCVDPFDCSGDAYSIPFYHRMLEETGKTSLYEAFWQNIANYQLDDWVEVHKGTAQDVATGWSKPIDLLLLDGDQSPSGARAAYDSWIPFLQRGGIIVVHNTRDRQYDEGHDGNRRLAIGEILPPRYGDIRQVGDITFGTKQF
jgi:MMP 1-O-methyltransferase